MLSYLDIYSYKTAYIYSYLTAFNHIYPSIENVLCIELKVLFLKKHLKV